MLIGRESELSRVEKQFRQQKHALIVINSKPKMGRSTFLDEVRSLAVKQKWRVIPPISSDDQMTSADIIAINRNTTKNDFW